MSLPNPIFSPLCWELLISATYEPNMQHLRRRTRGDDDDADDGCGDQVLLMEKSSSSRPSAHQLLSSEPLHSGYLRKRSRHVLWHMLLPRCCKDTWKSRFFVLAGTYLFRYSSEHGSSPKGVPLPMDACSFRSATAEEEDEAAAVGQVPRGVGFVVSTVRKEYHLRADTAAERAQWLRVFQTTKARAIKERLGHATANPKHAVANRAGATLFAKRVEDDATDGGASAAISASVEMSVLGGAAMSTYRP